MQSTYLATGNIKQNELYITANSRIAEYMHAQYAKNNNSNVFYSPHIYSLDNYLKQSCSKYFENELLLTSNECLIVWQKTAPEELKCISESTSLAHKAWQICTAYNILDSHLADSHYLEVEVFIKWKKLFTQYCRTNKLLCIDEIYARITDHPDQFAAEFEKINWIGFHEFSSQQQHMLDATKHQHTLSHLYKTANKTPQLHISDNPESDWHDMTAWIKDTRNKHPDEDIICAIPDLHNNAGAIARVMHSQFPGHSSEKPIFNISMTDRLIDHPLFSSIIMMAKSKLDNSSVCDFSNMLLSGLFCSDAGQRITAASLCNKMRGEIDLGANKKQILAFLKAQSTNFDCASKWFEFYSDETSTDVHLPSSWLDLICNHQQHLSWPGQFVHDNLGSQLWERWLKLKTEMKRLDYITKKINYNSFCSMLTSIIRKSSFQLYHRTPAAIQILSAVESAGIPVKNLWFASCDNNNWPLDASPNPFIPYELQRKLNLPHSSSEREYEFAKQITTTLIQQSRQITLQYNKTNNESQQKISPILKDLETVVARIPNIDKHIWKEAKARKLEDTASSAITTPTEQKGGSSVLQSTATCPLQAQMRWRIGIKQADKWRLGPDARDRGILLHSCLEKIWRELGNSTALNNISAEERAKLIFNAIADSLKPHENSTASDKIWLENEKELAARLITNWLDKELERPNFEVASCESKLNLSIGDLKLKLQVDRIDKTTSGDTLIIDYKTGTCTAKDLIHNKTTATQLPLYLYNKQNTATGICFAKINTTETKFIGISATELDTKGIKSNPDWNTIVKAWQEHLEDLAHRFASSDSRMMPYEQEKTCTHCEFHPICQEQENV
jgi:ATP-dependent helicase/nuclease subunit B